MKGSAVSFSLVLLVFFMVGAAGVLAEGEILPKAAGIGVGVGLGSIRLREALSPGGIYRLPNLPVVNTGLESGNFRVQAELVKGPVLVKQQEVKDWFRFTPSKFPLAAKKTHRVQTALALPFKAPPGDYLIFLEASQIRRAESQVMLSPVAATKLYFTIKPTSVLGAFRARVLTFIETNRIIYLILAGLLLIEAGLILRRRFRVRIETR